MFRPALVPALAVLALAACGKPQPPIIHFESHAPYYVKDKDFRFVSATCPYCRKPIPWGADVKKCPRKIHAKKKCEGELAWPKAIPCEYCRGSGVCGSCDAHKMADFKCFLCKGRGYTDFNTPCANCDGKGTCPLCKGKGTCDYCEKGEYSIEGRKGVQEPDLEDENYTEDSGA